MLPILVEQSWYQRVWLTPRAQPRAERLSLGARLAVRRLASAVIAVSALLSSRLRQADESSPSFR
jgi:hypothetical protein